MVFSYQIKGHSNKKVRIGDQHKLGGEAKKTNVRYCSCRKLSNNSFVYVYWYPNIINLVTNQNQKHKNIYNCMSDKVESPLKQFDDFVYQLTAHELAVYFHLCAVSTPAIRNIEENLECDTLDKILPKQLVEGTLMFIPPTMKQAFDIVSKIKANACSCFTLRTNVLIEMSIYIPAVEEIYSTECPNNIKALLCSTDAENYNLGKRLYINFYDKVLHEIADIKYIEPSWLTQDMILKLIQNEPII
jgi:hypothetical protein